MIIVPVRRVCLPVRYCHGGKSLDRVRELQDQRVELSIDDGGDRAITVIRPASAHVALSRNHPNLSPHRPARHYCRPLRSQAQTMWGAKTLGLEVIAALGQSVGERARDRHGDVILACGNAYLILIEDRRRHIRPGDRTPSRAYGSGTPCFEVADLDEIREF